jgi:hypothetical protein
LSAVDADGAHGGQSDKLALASRCGMPENENAENASFAEGMQEAE